MDSTIQVPIFTDTNLDTHIALSVHPHIPALDFKKQLEAAHLQCFPESKEIEVYGLLVKKKSFLYHLPDSLPIELAFEGVRGAWFLHVQARPSSKCVDSVTEDIDQTRISNDSGVVDPLEGKESRMKVPRRRRKKKKRDRESFLGKDLKADGDGGSAMRSTSGMSSEAKSVTSIIRRYFQNPVEKTVSGTMSSMDSEVTSKLKKGKNGCVRSNAGLRVRIRPSILLLPSSPGEIAGPEIGGRLVTASNNLGIFSGNRNSAQQRSISRASCENVIKRSIFEISDSDD